MFIRYSFFSISSCNLLIWINVCVLILQVSVTANAENIEINIHGDNRIVKPPSYYLSSTFNIPRDVFFTPGCTEMFDSFTKKKSFRKLQPTKKTSSVVLPKFPWPGFTSRKDRKVAEARRDIPFVVNGHASSRTCDLVSIIRILNIHHFCLSQHFKIQVISTDNVGHMIE